jgi:hypothetical protein
MYIEFLALNRSFRDGAATSDELRVAEGEVMLSNLRAGLLDQRHVIARSVEV